MPIYQYKCGHCEKTIEEIHNVKIKAIICPYCGGHATRIMSVSNFKVNGFNAKNLYSSNGKSDFIKQGPYDFERNLKKNGHRTAHDILNG